jgi:hypothetical protein
LLVAEGLTLDVEEDVVDGGKVDLKLSFFKVGGGGGVSLDTH